MMETNMAAEITIAAQSHSATWPLGASLSGALGLQQDLERVVFLLLKDLIGVRGFVEW
jgi:hypothetical protein